MEHEHEEAYARAGKRTNSLEPEGAENKPTAISAWNVFRNDHMRRGVVAAEREPQAEQTQHDLDVILADAEQRQECAEDDHLPDEHCLAPEIVG
jgi:hypothetical protein